MDLGFHICADDNNEFVPHERSHTKTWHYYNDFMDSYMGRGFPADMDHTPPPKVYVCPSHNANFTSFGEFSYGINPFYTGAEGYTGPPAKQISFSKTPTDTMMIMDWTSRIGQYAHYLGTTKETEVPRQGGRANVTYLDGHANALTAAKLKNTCAETQAKTWWNDFWSGAHP